jgi:hypothetical protein
MLGGRLTSEEACFGMAKAGLRHDSLLGWVVSMPKPIHDE